MNRGGSQKKSRGLALLRRVDHDPAGRKLLAAGMAGAVVGDTNTLGSYVTCRYARSASGSSLKEVPLNWNKWVRQTHRWLSIAFTVAVIVNIVAVSRGSYAAWVGFLALLPLALLLFTGLYLFVLPYATKWRSGRPIH